MVSAPLEDLAGTLVELQGALYASPVGVDGEWIRRMASLIVECRESVEQLEAEIEAERDHATIRIGEGE